MTVRFLYFPLPHYALPWPCLYTLTPKSFYQQQDPHMSLCCCNAIVCQQGEPVDQEPGWHCQEGWFCTWFRVPHHFAGCRTKVSQPQVNTAMSWLILFWMRRNMSTNEFCAVLFVQDGILWLAESIWNACWDGGPTVFTVSHVIHETDILLMPLSSIYCLSCSLWQFNLLLFIFLTTSI